MSTTSSVVTGTSDGSIPPWKRVVCGAVAGIAARTASAPIDVLKIRLQLQEARGPLSAVASLRTLIAREGMWALWKGNSAGVMLYASYSAIQFTLLDLLSSNACPLPVVSSFVNGGLAALVATGATYPLDLLRTRLAIMRRGHRVSEVFRDIVRHEDGLHGLFKGFGTTLCQVVPYMGCVFATHRLFASALRNQDTVPVDLTAGGLAGFCSKSLFMPVDVVRRRLQLYHAASDDYSIRKPSYIAAGSRRQLIVQMWHEEGLRAFFRGWTMAIIKSTPTTAISFAVYHFLLKRV